MCKNVKPKIYIKQNTIIYIKQHAEFKNGTAPRRKKAQGSDI